MTHQPQRTGGDMEEIVRRYQNTVYGLALVKTGSKADAEDVFQEVFLAYFQSGKTFHDEEHRKAWLLRTTLNMSRRVTASTWWKKTVPLTEEDAGDPVFYQPEERRVWEALNELPDKYRLPLYLFYFQGMSTEEIGKTLSLSPGAVRMRLSRGREQLKDSLKGDFFDE